MQISRVQRLSIPVSDQDKARDFYVDALGLELVLEAPVTMGEDARWIEVSPDGAETSIVLVTWLPASPGSGQGLMLETTDIDVDSERLRASGVTIEGPFETPWGRQATLEDPDGNGIVLAEAVSEDA